ncbi:MAG: ATP-binding protein [Rhodospirillales bacterium]
MLMQVQDSAPLHSWWEIIAIDILIILIACIATRSLFKKREFLALDKSFIGLGVLTFGIWFLTSIYVLDLFFTAIGNIIFGQSAALQFLQNLHTTYSWYIKIISVPILFLGVYLTVTKLTHLISLAEKNRVERLTSENLLQSIFDNIPLGIIIKDHNQHIETANRTYLDWYGLNKKDLIGRQTNRASSFINKQHISLAQELELLTLKNGTTHSHEIKRVFANGETHTLRVNKFPVLNEAGEVSKVGSVSIDLTELLNAKNDTEAALRVAEEANMAKSQFLATMSHELRTPLNAIIGYSELMNQNVFGPMNNLKYEEYSRDIYESGIHLLDLVSDILDISVIESGNQELFFEECNPVDILTECETIIKNQLIKQNITFSKTIENKLEKFCADARSVKQIILNILSNSIKFNKPHGSIHLEAKNSGRWLIITISDTGQGISKEHLNTITTPFYRANDNPLLAQPGVGLGLSIVSSLIKSHAGKLDIQSELDVGTTIKVSLPLNRERLEVRNSA